MLYHPVRRAFAFLAACAIIGVTAGLYVAQFQYDAYGVSTLVAGGFMIVLLLAFGSFAKPTNGMSAFALNVWRVFAVMLAFTLAGLVAIAAPGRQVVAGKATADPTTTKYTNWVDVNGCAAVDQTARKVDLTVSMTSDTCTAVLPLTHYSVVAVPDNVTVTLKSLEVDANAATGLLTLVFPVDSKVSVFVYDRTDTAHAVALPGWASADGLPRYTVFTA